VSDWMLKGILKVTEWLASECMRLLNSLVLKRNLMMI